MHTMFPNLVKLPLKTRSINGTWEDVQAGMDCSICLEPLNTDSPTYPWNGDGESVRQACNSNPAHYFHAGCLRSIVRSDPLASCPECRADLRGDAKDLAKLPLPGEPGEPGESGEPDKDQPKDQPEDRASASQRPYLYPRLYPRLYSRTFPRLHLRVYRVIARS